MREPVLGDGVGGNASRHTRATLASRGTDGSNPLPSSAESATNHTRGGASLRRDARQSFELSTRFRFRLGDAGYHRGRLAGAVPLRIIAWAARSAFLRNVKLEAVVSIGFSY
jgi:hypothetical protein